MASAPTRDKVTVTVANENMAALVETLQVRLGQRDGGQTRSNQHLTELEDTITETATRVEPVSVYNRQQSESSSTIWEEQKSSSTIDQQDPVGNKELSVTVPNENMGALIEALQERLEQMRETQSDETKESDVPLQQSQPTFEEEQEDYSFPTASLRATSDGDVRTVAETQATTVLGSDLESQRLDEIYEENRNVFVPPTDLISSQDIVSEAQARYYRQRAALLDKMTEPNLTKEPSRDWECGLLTGHRITCLAVQGMLMAAIYYFQNRIWPNIDHQPQTPEEELVSKFALVWMCNVLPSIIGFVGIIWYRHNPNLDSVPPMSQNLVVWRIVSRGTNRDTLAATVEQCRDIMAKTAMFPYVIEVITDEDTPYLTPTEDLIKLLVPEHFETARGTLYKARALHYASVYSPVPDTAWLVHLDEESHPTSSGIKGIAKMISEEEKTGKLRFGQGAILYHRDWRKHPFLTLADNIRTGDDFARFHLQMRLGVSIFGIHGSYVVCRNDVEKKLGGFDFGPTGSITEDAYWALKAMDAGIRGRWVDGYMEEQSTQSVSDFMKQRRRWFLGLVLVSLFAPVRFRRRVGLLLSTILWALAPLALLFTILHFIFSGAFVHPVVRALVNFAYCSSWMLYLMGLKANMLEHGMSSKFEKSFWWCMQLLLVPVFTILESLSIMYAIMCPSCGFHIISK